jgi:hypothetical protein
MSRMQIPAVIPEGTRELTLFKIGSSFQGVEDLGLAGIDAALMAINQERCIPPLPDKEVHHAAKMAARYAPNRDNPKALRQQAAWRIQFAPRRATTGRPRGRPRKRTERDQLLGLVGRPDKQGGRPALSRAQAIDVLYGAAISQGKGLSTSAVAAKLGMSYQTAYRCLSRLRARGMVVYDGWTWQPDWLSDEETQIGQNLAYVSARPSWNEVPRFSTTYSTPSYGLSASTLSNSPDFPAAKAPISWPTCPIHGHDWLGWHDDGAYCDTYGTVGFGCGRKLADVDVGIALGVYHSPLPTSPGPLPDEPGVDHWRPSEVVPFPVPDDGSLSPYLVRFVNQAARANRDPLSRYELDKKALADRVRTAVNLRHRTVARREIAELTADFTALYERWAHSGNKQNALMRKLFEKLDRLDVGKVSSEQLYKARDAQPIAPAKRVRRKVSGEAA